jgi:hypothetical protein
MTAKDPAVSHIALPSSFAIRRPAVIADARRGIFACH